MAVEKNSIQAKSKANTSPASKGVLGSKKEISNLVERPLTRSDTIILASVRTSAKQMIRACETRYGIAETKKIVKTVQAYLHKNASQKRRYDYESAYREDNMGEIIRGTRNLNNDEFLKFALINALENLYLVEPLFHKGGVSKAGAIILYGKALEWFGITQGFLVNRIFTRRKQRSAGKKRFENDPKQHAKEAIKIAWSAIPKSKKTYGWKAQFSNQMQAKHPNIEDVETIKKWVRQWEKTLSS